MPRHGGFGSLPGQGGFGSFSTPGRTMVLFSFGEGSTMPLPSTTYPLPSYALQPRRLASPQVLAVLYKRT